MNKDTIEGAWTQLKGSVREKWGNLTDDEIESSKGSFQKLSGTIQKKYGQSKDKVESELSRFYTDHDFKLDDKSIFKDPHM